MVRLDVVLDADGAFPELEGAEEVAWDRVGILADGTTDGRTAVCLVLRAADGRRLFAQTTLRLFMNAARAFSARFMKDEVGP